MNKKRKKNNGQFIFFYANNPFALPPSFEIIHPRPPKPNASQWRKSSNTFN